MKIDGKNYIESPAGFGNACRQCAFNRTPCYNRTDFSCHGDSRKDGEDIVFLLDENQEVRI